MTDNVIKYAVIGGGVAGAYCAWRLKRADPSMNVALFEASSRIGGRLFTASIPGVNSFRAELGGMRYIPGDDNQKLITRLVEALGLQTRNFPMGGQDDPNGLRNYAYFRGRHLRVGDFSDSSKVPFHVDWAELNKSPNQLQTQIMRQLVPNWQTMSFDDWFEVDVFGKPLWKYGFWNLLYRVLGPDAFLFLRYGSGYDTNVSNGNAVTLLPTGGNFNLPEYKTLVDGMQAIPEALADKFEREHGGTINKNLRLASITRRENDLYTLRFFRTATQNGKTQDIDPPEVVDYEAEHIILAMPRRALELVEWEKWHTDPWLRENFGSVLIQSAIKIFLAYDYAWWKELGLEAGRSITDLPLRQTYYFTSRGPSEGKALLMASYNDIDSVPFWKGLEGPPYFEPGPEGYQASQAMVEEVHRQILELHGIRELPRPCAAAYMDWSDDPYGGGWHCWKAGVKYNCIMPQMRHPVRSEKVYICGEAYSANQGWVEGALETAEALLSEDLQIPDEELLRGAKPDPLERLNY